MTHIQLIRVYLTTPPPFGHLPTRSVGRTLNEGRRQDLGDVYRLSVAAVGDLVAT